MLDEFRSTNITWDKATSRIYSPVTANESDSNGRKLNIQVVNSGQVENLTGATLHLYWETKDKVHDGLDAFTASDISKGEFEIFYTTGMLSNVGELNATLVLVDSTGKVVSDWFKITVTRGINESAIESENSFSSLTKALIDISDLEQNYAPRLNDLTAQLQQTMSQIEFDSWVATLLDGGPSIFMETLSALNAAYPTGSSGVALVRETDPARIYVWSGSQWEDFGAYQGIELKKDSVSTSTIKDRAIVPEKLEPVVESLINPETLKLNYKTNMIRPAQTSFIGGTLLYQDGSVYAAENWSTSKYIDAEPITEYRAGYLRFKMEYDKYKRPLSNTWADQPTGERVFTTSPHTRYVRYNTPTNRITLGYFLKSGVPVENHYPFEQPKLTLEDGSPITVDFVENPGIDFEIRPSKNLFDKRTVKKDTNIDFNTGAESNTISFDASAHIKVKKNSRITFNKPVYVTEFDKRKEYLKTYHDNSQVPTSTIALSPSTEYIRLASRNINVDTLQAEYGDSVTPYEDFHLVVYYNGVKTFDLVDNGTGTPSPNLLSLSDYQKFVDRQKYQIWKFNGNKKVMAILRDVAVRANGKQDGSVIEISTNGINGNYSSQVVFDSTNFPNLLPLSNIEHIMLVPWTRNATNFRPGDDWRMLVITNKGQIYHNFPSRNTTSDGMALPGDMLRFDESVVWDLPERKYPSKDPDASGVEKYFPGLPEERYQYYPRIDSDNGFGHGGFGKFIAKEGMSYPRFYQPGRTMQTNSFGYMGGFEPDNKIQIIGTYKANLSEAVRVCLFASDDGGRNWFVKYEFTTEKAVLHTPISSSSVTHSYTPNSLVISKRNLVLPTIVNKEPSHKFGWGEDIAITNIERGATTVVTTSKAHLLGNGDVIAIKSSGNHEGFEWMVNDSITENSGGNGVLFGIKWISYTSFEIYEYVSSAHNNIPARHIHYVNRVKDGWLFGTGEEYPNGFIFYMQMKESDAYRNKLAHETFDIIRLTSAEGAAQRLIGADMWDDEDSTLIVAMDNEYTQRDDVNMPEGRTETFNRSSTGIFRGPLSNLDDLDSLNVVFEAKQVAYFFKRKADVYIYTGQQGEFALSFDKGNTWTTEDVREKVEHFGGESKKYVVLDNFILVIK